MISCFGVLMMVLMLATMFLPIFNMHIQGERALSKNHAGEKISTSIFASLHIFYGFNNLDNKLKMVLAYYKCFHIIKQQISLSLLNLKILKMEITKKVPSSSDFFIIMNLYTEKLDL